MRAGLEKKLHGRRRRRRYEPSVRAHRKAHAAVLGNEAWYRDGDPDLGPAFTAKKTAERHRAVIEILLRAARRAERTKDGELAHAYQDLADKLSACRRRTRCGSAACPICGRAFQRAKTIAQEAALRRLMKAYPGKKIVFVTIIPAGMSFRPGELNKLEITKANRWFKDRLVANGIKRRMLASGDVSWERRRDQSGYWQYHWHSVMHTRNSDQLENKLKAAFPPTRKYERSVDVTEATNLGFLGYKNKLLKLPDVLRRARSHLPELLLLLDRTDPMDLLLMRGFRVRAEDGGFSLRPLRNDQRRRMQNNRAT